MARRDDDGKKKVHLITMWTLEANGALAAVGDEIGTVDRVSQETMAASIGVTRSTMNRRINNISAPCAQSKWSEARRDEMSRQVRRRAELQGKKLRAGERKIRQRIATIVRHNGGFAQSHSYAVPESARPEIRPGKNEDPKEHARLLAQTFGEKLFDPNMEVNGYRKTGKWGWHPNLPFPRPCPCSQGQGKFSFQDVCPLCKGHNAHRLREDGTVEVVPASLLERGDVVKLAAGQSAPGDADVLEGNAYVDGVPFKAGQVVREGQQLQTGELKLRIRSTKAGFYLRRVPCERRGCQKQTGKARHDCPRCMGSGEMFESLPDYGRMLLHFIQDRLQPNDKGVLKSYTQRRIGEMIGLDVSTVRLYERTLEWLDIIQVIPGEVIREYPGGPIKKRHPHKILFLPEMVLDGDRVELEKTRLARAVSALKPMMKGESEAAFKRVQAVHQALLREWQGRQHQIHAFHSEMRRRLAAENVHKSIIEALFPLMRV